jgi:hypothetical protein
MRTPGRCTNFETCWLANGRRDIRVMIGDPFVCPACGEPLQAPSIESISASGIAGAVAVSLALIAAAGGAGFGAVRLAQTSNLTTVAKLMYAPGPRSPLPRLATATNPLSAPAQRTATAVAQADQLERLGEAAIRTAPAPAEVLASIPPATFAPEATPAPEMAVQSLPPPLPPHLPGTSNPTGKVIVVSAEPHRQLKLPISFGRPVAPEDDVPARSAHWRHHSIGFGRRTGFLPAPSWSAEDASAVEQVQQAVPPAQGDADSDTPAIEVGDAAAEQEATPSQQDDTPAPAASADNGVAADTGATMPTQQSNIDVPGAAPLGGARFDGMSAPSQVTGMVLPAMVGDVRVPVYQVAARVDPGEAAELDHARNGDVRLAVLPPAPAAKLAVPAYPPRDEEINRPGRVDVGCVITPRGLPAGCQVQRQEGGETFAHAVMSWLNSGEVRYRPSIVAGRLAAEPRDYKVRFEP